MSSEYRFNERQQKRFAHALREGNETHLQGLAKQYGVELGKLYEQHIRRPRDAERIFGVNLKPGQKDHLSYHKARQLAHRHGALNVRGIAVPEPDTELLSQPKQRAEVTA